MSVQTVLCKLSLFNMQLVKHQLNCWAIDFSLKNCKRQVALSLFPYNCFLFFLSLLSILHAQMCRHTSDRRQKFSFYLSSTILLTTAACPLSSFSAGVYSWSSFILPPHLILHLICISSESTTPSAFSVLITDETTSPNLSFCLLSKQKYWPVSLTCLCEFVTSRVS